MYVSPDATLDAAAKAKAVVDAQKAIEKAKKAVAQAMKAKAFLEDNGLNPIAEDWIVPQSAVRKEVPERRTTTRASRATILPQNFLMNAPKLTTIQGADNAEPSPTFSRPVVRRTTILPDWMTNPRLKNNKDGIASAPTACRVRNRDPDEPSADIIDARRRDSTATILPVEAEEECEDHLSDAADRVRAQSDASSPRQAPCRSVNARDTTQHYDGGPQYGQAPAQSVNARDTTQHYDRGPQYTETTSPRESPQSDLASPQASRAPRAQPSSSIPFSRVPRLDMGTTRASAPAEATGGVRDTPPCDHSASTMSSFAASPRRAAHSRRNREGKEPLQMAAVDATSDTIIVPLEKDGPVCVHESVNRPRSLVSASGVNAPQYPSCSAMSTGERSSGALPVQEDAGHRYSSRYAKRSVAEEEAGIAKADGHRFSSRNAKRSVAEEKAGTEEAKGHRFSSRDAKRSVVEEETGIDEADGHRFSSRYAEREELDVGTASNESDTYHSGRQSLYIKSLAFDEDWTREDSFSNKTVPPPSAKLMAHRSTTMDSESDHCLANLTSGHNSACGGNRNSETDSDGASNDSNGVIPLVNAPKCSTSVYYNGVSDNHLQDDGMKDTSTSLCNAPNQPKSVYYNLQGKSKPLLVSDVGSPDTSAHWNGIPAVSECASHTELVDHSMVHPSVNHPVTPHDDNAFRHTSQPPMPYDDQATSSWDTKTLPRPTNPRDTGVCYAEDDNSLSPSPSGQHSPAHSGGNKLATASLRQSDSLVGALEGANDEQRSVYDEISKRPFPRASAVVDVALGLNLGCITNRLTANATKYLEQAAQLQQCADEMADEVVELGGFPTELRESLDQLLTSYRTWAEEVVRTLKVDDRIHLEEAKMIGEQYFRSLYDAIRPDIEWEEAVGLAAVHQICEELPIDTVYNYTDDLVILYEMALYAQPYVDAVALYVKNQLQSDADGAFCGHVSVSAGKVKRLGRILEKIFHASTDQTFPSRVTDMARCMMVFKSMEAMARALVILKECDEINILRVKNRWAEPTHAGWSDVVILFEFILDHPAEQHVCEFQLVHERMAHADVGKNGQLKYHSMRTCGELLDMFLGRAGGLPRITEIAEDVLITEEPE